MLIAGSFTKTGFSAYLRTRSFLQILSDVLACSCRSSTSTRYKVYIQGCKSCLCGSPTCRAGCMHALLRSEQIILPVLVTCSGTPIHPDYVIPVALYTEKQLHLEEAARYYDGRRVLHYGVLARLTSLVMPLEDYVSGASDVMQGSCYM